MDGRTQDKALAYAKQLFATDNIDSITEPGIDGILAGVSNVVGADDMAKAQEWVRVKADISSSGHGSSQVVIFGHCGCAGVVTDLEGHKAHLAEARKTVEAWGLFKEIHTAVFNEDFEIEAVD
jgi:hypothetical protein